MKGNVRGRGFFARHARSSAALVSLGIHAVLLIIALSFVAVTVVQRVETVFEGQPVYRPKMKLRKLQVPVDIKKVKTQPKLRKQIVSIPKLNHQIDIKMPEIVGVSGGVGTGGGGIGMGAGIGFSMPEINLFGVKSAGEKIFVVLDASENMMYDEMGGIRAYELIKQELVRILEGLPSTVLFNIAVHDKWNTYLLFPGMVSANDANVDKVNRWLEPLNAVRSGMGAGEWGPRTLGEGGSKNDEDLRVGKLEQMSVMESWNRSVMLAMKQQADTVFVLTAGWGFQRFALGEKDQSWYGTSDGKRFMENYQKALALLDEDNRKRAEDGEPPRAIARSDRRLMVQTYVPGGPIPPEPEYYYLTPAEFIKAIQAVREQHQTKLTQKTKSALRKKGEKEFTFNVIHFERVDSTDAKTENNFKRMTSYFNGEFRKIRGLEAIESEVKAGGG